VADVAASSAAGERAGVATAEFALCEVTAAGPGAPGHAIGNLTISVVLMAAMATAAIAAPQYNTFFERITCSFLSMRR
jgi:hypothetical protein